MDTSGSLLQLSAGIGAITGFRSMAAVATLSRSLHRRQLDAGGILSQAFPAGALTLAQAGEVVGDKLPFVPARTHLAPLLGRAAIAGFACAVLANDRRAAPLAPALVGAAAALASTVAITNLRRFATTRLHVPDMIFALAEDTVVLRACAELAASLDQD